MEHVFVHLASQSKLPRLRKLWFAPFYLHKNLITRIDALGTAASQGKDTRIVVKMNSLTDEALIHSLMRAGLQGVRIDLIVRGACMLPAQMLPLCPSSSASWRSPLGHSTLAGPAQDEAASGVRPGVIRARGIVDQRLEVRLRPGEPEHGSDRLERSFRAEEDRALRRNAESEGSRRPFEELAQPAVMSGVEVGFDHRSRQQTEAGDQPAAEDAAHLGAAGLRAAWRLLQSTCGA